MRLRIALASVVAPLVVIVIVVAAGRWVSGEAAADTRSPLASALDTLPADTRVASFTDWSRIRAELDLGSASRASDRAALTDDASLRDLSTRSVLGPSTEAMHRSYGWSAADLEWEAYGQADDGAAMVARLDGSVSFDSVRSRLAKIGYTEDDGVWVAGDKTRAAVGVELTSTLGSIALVPDQRLVVAADRPAYASTVVRTIGRDTRSLLSVRSAAGVADALVGADGALLQSGAFACSSTSLAASGEDVRAQARAAVSRSGDLVRPAFTGRAIDGGTKSTERMRFAFGFDSPAVAARQLQIRTSLASGPFIGRSGRVEESLVLASSGVRGGTATLRFRHDPDSTPYMTGDGPLLFAGCSP